MPVLSTLYTRLAQVAVGAIIGAAVAAVGVGSPAWAHNSLVEAVPAEDSVIQETPAEVRLRFLNKLRDDTALEVADPAGGSAIGKVTVDGKEIFAPFTGTASGRYTVTYSLISADGHKVSESFPFTLELPGSPSAGPDEVTEPVATTPTGSPAPSGTDGDVALTGDVASESRTPWWVWIGGAAVAGLLVGGVLSYLRRRRES